MDGLPHELYRPEQVAALDRRAIDTCGVPGALLMERSGVAAYRVLRERWPDCRAPCVLCGGGNNGGDGLVLARLAREAGLVVDLGLAGDPQRLKGSAARAWQDLAGGAGKLDDVDPCAADLVVDALLGTGLDRDVEGRMADTIEAINAAGVPVLSIDIPSGLHADSGAVMGTAVRADLTVGFIGAKRGLYTGPGVERAGTVLLDDLDVPAAVYRDTDPSVRLWYLDQLGTLLPPRPASAHKGNAGHVLVVGGSPGFAGAARLAGEAALRAGAGLVSVATMPAQAGAIVSGCPGLMVHGAEDAADIAPLLDRADVVAIGPGLGRDDWGERMLEAVLSAPADRLLVDADGLNQLASVPRALPADSLITPHPGEAARLLATSVADVQADRFAAAAALHERHGAAVLLKGPGTIVTGDGVAMDIAGTVEPALAVGGSGDVLTGVAAGLRAQGIDRVTAACAATLALLSAGRLAAGHVGTRSVTPMDLLDALGPVLAGPHG